MRADADVEARPRRSRSPASRSCSPRTATAPARSSDLREDPDVLWAEADQRRAASPPTRSPRSSGASTTSARASGAPASERADADIDAPEAWTVTRGAGATVAVVDTGVDTGHPDLADEPSARLGLRRRRQRPDRRQRPRHPRRRHDRRGRERHRRGGRRARGARHPAARARRPTATAGAPTSRPRSRGPATTACASSTPRSAPAASPRPSSRRSTIIRARCTSSRPATRRERRELAPVPVRLHRAERRCASAPPTSTTTIAGFSNYGATSVDLFAPGVEIVSTYPRGLTSNLVTHRAGDGLS